MNIQETIKRLREDALNIQKLADDIQMLTGMGHANIISEIKPKSHHKAKRHIRGVCGEVIHTQEVEEARNLIKDAYARGLTQHKIASLIGTGNSLVYAVLTGTNKAPRGMKKVIVDRIMATLK